MLVDGVSVGTPGSYTFTNVTAAHTIAASFAAAPGSQNLVANPGFETNLAGWGNYGTTTLSRVGGGHSGSWAMQMATTGSGSFGCDDLPNVVTTVAGVGLTYRITAWVRSAAARGRVKIRVYEMNGSSQVGSTFYSNEPALSTTWQLLTADYVVRQAGTTLNLRITDTPVASGESFLVDDLSVVLLSPAPHSSAPAPLAVPDAGGTAAEALRFGARVAQNPAHGRTTIELATTRAGALRVELYDVNGRRVQVLADETYAAPGRRSLAVGDRAAMEPGVYFYRVAAREGSLRGRVVIVR